MKKLALTLSIAGVLATPVLADDDNRGVYQDWHVSIEIHPEDGPNCSSHTDNENGYSLGLDFYPYWEQDGGIWWSLYTYERTLNSLPEGRSVHLRFRYSDGSEQMFLFEVYDANVYELPLYHFGYGNLYPAHYRPDLIINDMERAEYIELVGSSEPYSRQRFSLLGFSAALKAFWECVEEANHVLANR